MLKFILIVFLKAVDSVATLNEGLFDGRLCLEMLSRQIQSGANVMSTQTGRPQKPKGGSFRQRMFLNFAPLYILFDIILERVRM